MCHCIAEWCALFSPARFSPCILLLYCCMISFGKWNIIVSLSNCRSLGPGFYCPQLSLPSITQQIRVPVRRENAQHHSAFGKMNTVKNHFQFQRRNQLEPCRDIPNGQQIGLSVSEFSIITVLLEPKVNWSELKLRDTSTRWAYDVPLPIWRTGPNTVESSTVEQFHLRERNCHWHSAIPALAPRPTDDMWSW